MLHNLRPHPGDKGWREGATNKRVGSNSVLLPTLSMKDSENLQCFT